MMSRVNRINFSEQFVLPIFLYQLHSIPGMLHSRPVHRVCRERNSTHNRGRNMCSILHSSWILSGRCCSPGSPVRNFGSWACSCYWDYLASSAHNLHKGCYCRSYYCSRSCYCHSYCYCHSCCYRNRLDSE